MNKTKTQPCLQEGQPGVQHFCVVLYGQPVKSHPIKSLKWVFQRKDVLCECFCLVIDKPLNHKFRWLKISKKPCLQVGMEGPSTEVKPGQIPWDPSQHKGEVFLPL